MNYIQRLTVHGFRRLADVEFDLRPLTVLIGANGIGKTSILDVLTLLAKSAQGKLRETISDYSGMAAILTYDRAKDVSFELSSSWETAVFVYELRIRAIGGVSYSIEQEKLTLQVTGMEPGVFIDSRGSDIKYFDDHGTAIPPREKYDRFETSLSQIPREELSDLFRDFLASSTLYHSLSIEPRSAVRLPQPMRPASLPGINGEDLVSCLYSLRETERERFETIEDTLRSAFPGFERLDFPPVAAGTLAMTWRDSRFSKPPYTHQLSEGMLRFLWLVTLLQSPGLTERTLIDEPEVSMHPELLSLLADLFREASQRTQLIVATHSDSLVRFLQPSEVAVVDTDEDGLASLTWADQFDLDEWLKEYTLDELWRKGRIGGRA